MKLLRYKTGKPEHKGILDGDKVKRINGSLFLDYNITDDSVPVSDITFLPPILPGKIIGIRGNYGSHSGGPLFFMKPRSGVAAHNENIICPQGDFTIRGEGELAVVIGKKCRNANERTASACIMGYTIANDVTANSPAYKETFTEGKWFDTFTPLGPVIDTKINYDDLEITTRLNGKEVQRGSTSGMIFKPPFIVARLSSVMTLEPGDVILMGTPSPAFKIVPGDMIEISIEGIGVLINKAEARLEER